MARIVHLFGASVRALAFSALRAGWTPVCHDLFADADLTRVAQAHRIDRADYPRGFRRSADRIGGRPWLYTGGLENHPELLSVLAANGPLWGNPAGVLDQVRDPFALAETFAAFPEEEVSFPTVSADAKGAPTDATWLVKPRRGTGGYGIDHWTGGPAPENCFWQRCVPGVPHAAAFLGADEDHAILLGVTRQLVGAASCRAPAFAYCGSVGPAPMSCAARECLMRIGTRLVRSFRLRGLFGLDFLLDGERIRPIEVNPRYPASLEVLERSLGFSAFELHQRVFGSTGRDSILIADPTNAADRVSLVGKAIIYASAPCRIVARAPCYDDDAGLDHYRYADIPGLDMTFEPGDPILTVFASAETLADCQAGLRGAVDRFRASGLRSL